MTIHSNGSKWMGQEPDGIPELMAMLSKTPLDSTFENYGGFFHKNENGTFTASGNFVEYSHVFNITGTLAELLPIAKAIKANRQTVAYLKHKHS